MHYTLCDMFADLTQNSVEAGADEVTVELVETGETVEFRLADNGRGMTPEELAKATDPFCTDGIKHPGRKVGLGLPFMIQTAESCGGSWNIRSDKGKGTEVSCRFDLTNIDTPPVGDVAGYFRQVLTFEGRYEMAIKRKTPSLSYAVRRSDLLEALGLPDDGSLFDAESIGLMGRYLESMEE